ncbi:ribbon-helix-helix protein, CopG family [Solimonas soli]|uniref:ribbon-helix-helix protein, CopG family n=1 Tax=Solimonas soli TaxID=413479 RepID=UPI000480582F|nr:ribbon-helix-helix protein, CopG family [Solimonas soli]
MNFSVHLDDETVDRLNQAAARVGLTRNRVITLAVQDWLAHNEEKDWPAALKRHFGNPAPELAEDTLDFQAWREALPEAAQVRW